MSFIDTFKGNQYKQENEVLKATVATLQTEIKRLKADYNQLEKKFTPEMNSAVELMQFKEKLQSEIEELNKTIKERNDLISKLQVRNTELIKQSLAKKQEILDLDEQAELQSFGLYRPRYDFASSDIYKDRLAQIRTEQKQMVKNNQAVTGNMQWTVNGSIAQGKKMVKDMQKLLLRAFNSECDELIDKVKYNTFDTASKRMENSFEAISKLGKIMNVAITRKYYNSKYEELCLALEYRKKKQDEKEEQKEIRARMREEAKLQKEIEEARRKIAKEQTHYQNVLNRLEQQIAAASDDEKSELLKKKSEIEGELTEIDKSLKNVDYREANARAGYVYIISNIGSFGENVYKIGMTRRLEPMDRVDELGDASVPFNFDVHAMIFSDNAPALEAALHRAFENRKLNMINTRREFFNVTLDEIEAVVKKNYDKTVEFVRLAPAEQYRESLKIREEAK